MKKEGWDNVVLSDVDYEALIVEVHHNGQLLFQLDMEDGPQNICVSFPSAQDGDMGARVSLTALLQRIDEAVKELVPGNDSHRPE